MADPHGTALRLINIQKNLELQSFECDAPAYAILSHTWITQPNQEVTYEDWQRGTISNVLGKVGLEKIVAACRQAQSDGFGYIWIDTCCIDKHNSTELDEAISSMYTWYRNSSVCYIHLSDVHSKASADEIILARWFTRGWTLQELLAPRSIVFFAKDWTLLGTLEDLLSTVSIATGISEPFLRQDPSAFARASAAQRLSWASGRHTKLPKDRSYSLLGILDIHIPVNYTRGIAVFETLQKEILVNKENGLSVLAWSSADSARESYLLAETPDLFERSGDVDIDPDSVDTSQLQVNNTGLTGWFDIVQRRQNGFDSTVALLACHRRASPHDVLGLRIVSHRECSGHGTRNTYTYCVDASWAAGGFTSTRSRLTTVTPEGQSFARKKRLTIRFKCRGPVSQQRDQVPPVSQSDSVSGWDSAVGFFSPEHMARLGSGVPMPQPAAPRHRVPYARLSDAFDNTSYNAARHEIDHATFVTGSTTYTPGETSHSPPFHRGREVDITHTFNETSGPVTSSSLVRQPARYHGPYTDTRQQLQYSYDSWRDEIVYQSGVRIPRPAHTPRSNLLRSASTSAAMQNDFVGSPPQRPQDYWYGSDPSNTTQGISPQRNPQSAASQPFAPRRQDATQPQPAAAVSELTAGLARMNTNQQASPIQPRVESRNGVTYVTASDPRTQVHTIMGVHPPERITDRGVLEVNPGIRAHRIWLGTAGNEERLYSEYKLRDRPDRFFVPGRVFMVLWAEPAGESYTVVSAMTANDRLLELEEGDDSVTRGRYSERVFSKVRRFVVVRAGTKYCSALPVTSYSQQGVGKNGVNKAEHAIVHTGRDAPQSLASEQAARGEAPMLSQPIRVLPDAPADKLDPLSRIDFGKIHTVQHNIKVKAFGMVHSSSMAALAGQFALVWQQLAPVPAPATDSAAAQQGLSRAPQAARRIPNSPPNNGEGDDGEAGDASENEGHASAEEGVEHSDERVDDDEDGEGTDDPEGSDNENEAGDSSGGEDAAPIPSPPSSAPDARVPTGMTASQAMNIRTAFARLMQQGQTPAQATETLVQNFRGRMPNLTREGALSMIRAGLQYRS